MMQHAASALGADPACASFLGREASLSSALRVPGGRRRAGSSKLEQRTGSRPCVLTRGSARGNPHVNVTAAVAESRPRTATAAPFSISHGPVTLSEDKYKITSHRVPVTVTVQREPNGDYTVNITCGLQEPVVLHWGVNNWQVPPKEVWPDDTKQVDKSAIQTTFKNGKIRITFPSTKAPENIKFVLKQLNPQAWHNCGGTDFHVNVRPATAADHELLSGSSRGPSTPDTLLHPNVRELLIKVAEFENRAQLSLFQRFQLALELVPAPDKADPETMSVLLAWLQYSANKHLPWHRGNTYDATQMAKAQEDLAQRFADVASRASDSSSRVLARQILALLPRGGGNAEEIPGGLAHTMRTNNIREGHSNHNGIEDRFLEEWKRKLEGSTTQEDVAICEAYLHFLHSGDWNQFYQYIWDNHRISRDRLESMDRPIRSPAVHLPQLIPAMKHFLWVLKITHSGITLDESVEFAKGYLDEELKGLLYEVLANRNEWYVPGKIADARARLAKVWRRPEGAPRDVLLLDIALEKHFRLCIERTDKASLKDDDVIEVVNLVLRNAAIAGEWPELEKAQRFWDKVRTAKDRWSKDWVARASAAANFITVALEAGMDRLAEHVAQPAQVVGQVTRVKEEEILKFAEELVSSQSPGALSDLIELMERPLRNKDGGASQWVVASSGAGVATGRLLRKHSLKEVQGAVFRDPTVLIIDGGVSPNDEVPDGVVAIVAAGGVDQMGHLAIQARARKVFLAGCHHHDALTPWHEFGDGPVNVAVTPAGDVVMTAAAPYTGPRDSSRNVTGFYRTSHARTSAWVIAEEQFSEELVGAKALKCRALRKKMIGSEVAVPATIAIPFGTFERVLADPINGPIRDEFVDLVNQLSREPHPARLSASLEQIRMLLSTCLAPPDGLSVELAALAVRNGLVDPNAAPEDVDDFSAIWDAICKVWASKWTDRAWLSRRARGEPDSSVFMSVLIQKIVPAQFSFTLKTAEPLTGAHGQMSGEVVIGLGEALVGNFPGRALTFTTQQGGRDVTVKTLPSKAVAFRVSKKSALICRPDWSSADTEDATGARLFESAPVSGVEMETPEYADEELVWHSEFQQRVLREISDAGWKVEGAFGGQPLEIEGVYSQGKVAVVQARPQVFPQGSRGGMMSAR